MNNDRIEGAVREATGKVQGAAGDLADSERTSTEGRAREAAGTLQNAYGQAKNALHDVAEEATELAGQAYRQGSRYVRDGGRLVDHRASDSPLASLLIAGVAGYALGFLIHGRD